MSDETQILREQMEMAAAAGDFERAALLRDRLSLARSGVADAATVDTTILTRQQPGAMGIGSNHGRPARPAGWTTPKKPDPLTTNTSRPKRPRRGRGG